ncbi:helix-turn-helix domain-containing protein [Streptomyces sp. NPDC008079]|uniref:helix-turn-helix domain-containing protein n=1 Tax=Streptomyces sp. NPDC008079 TaxID=3364806 RepID=UPI0036E2F3DA
MDQENIDLKQIEMLADELVQGDRYFTYPPYTTQATRTAAQKAALSMKVAHQAAVYRAGSGWQAFTNSEYIRLGRAIRSARKAKGIDRGEFATQSAVPLEILSALEEGRIDGQPVEGLPDTTPPREIIPFLTWIEKALDWEPRTCVELLCGANDSDAGLWFSIPAPVEPAVSIEDAQADLNALRAEKIQRLIGEYQQSYGFLKQIDDTYGGVEDTVAAVNALNTVFCAAIRRI